MQSADENQNLLIFMDLDGSLADSYERFLQAGEEPSREDRAAYLEWLNAVQNTESLLLDQPLWPVWTLLQAVTKAGAKIVYLTSREERWRDVTKDWLKMYSCPPGPLIMRQNGDWRGAGELKGDVIEETMNRYPFFDVIVIDDDQRGDLAPIVRQLGATHFKVTDCLLNMEDPTNE